MPAWRWRKQKKKVADCSKRGRKKKHLCGKEIFRLDRITTSCNFHGQFFFPVIFLTVKSVKGNYCQNKLFLDDMRQGHMKCWGRLSAWKGNHRYSLLVTSDQWNYPTCHSVAIKQSESTLILNSHISHLCNSVGGLDDDFFFPQKWSYAKSEALKWLVAQWCRMELRRRSWGSVHWELHFCLLKNV